MNKLFAVLVVLFAFATSATAEDKGRPDPTGQGRYLQFGSEVPYLGARVISELPAGAECAVAGELVGVRVWNSVGEGKAILSELTDKAMLAVTPEGIFLCKCARGFNQIFIPSPAPEPVKPPAPAAPKVPEPAAPAPTPTPQVAPTPAQPVTVNNDVNVVVDLPEDSRVEPRLQPLPDDYGDRKKRRIFTGKRVGIGATAAAVAWGIWYFWCDLF